MLKIIFFWICIIYSCFCFPINKSNLLYNKVSVEHKIFEIIPFELIDGHIIIKVKINDEFYNFLFDTGAPTIIDENLNQLYKVTGKSKSVYDINYNYKTLNIVTIPVLCINEEKIKKVKAISTSLLEINKLLCVNISGIIGADLMSNYFVQINYYEKTIIFSDNIKSFKINSFYKPVKFTYDSSMQPKITIYQDELNFGDFILDTGSSNSVKLTKGFDSKNISKDTKTSYAIVHGAFGSEVDTIQTDKLTNLTINKTIKLDSISVDYKNKKTIHTVGFKVLRNYITTLDWKRKEVYFEKIKYDSPNISNPFGISFQYHEGKIIIGKIYKNSITNLKGVKLFDEVLKINEIFCDKLSKEAYCTLFSDNEIYNKSKIKLTIKSSSDSKIFELVLLK